MALLMLIGSAIYLASTWGIALIWESIGILKVCLTLYLVWLAILGILYIIQDI